VPSAKAMRIAVTLLVTVRPASTALPAIVGPSVVPDRRCSQSQRGTRRVKEKLSLSESSFTQ
jgi:hypothetical protein